MNKINAFWVGFASILSLLPSNERPKVSSPSELMKYSWNNVGKAIRQSMDSYTNGQEKK